VGFPLATRILRQRIPHALTPAPAVSFLCSVQVGSTRLFTVDCIIVVLASDIRRRECDISFLRSKGRYALPVRTGRTYGCQKMHPYIRAVKTARTYGPYVRVVRIGLKLIWWIGKDWGPEDDFRGWVSAFSSVTALTLSVQWQKGNWPWKTCSNRPQSFCFGQPAKRGVTAEKGPHEQELRSTLCSKKVDHQSHGGNPFWGYKFD